MFTASPSSSRGIKSKSNILLPKLILLVIFIFNSRSHTSTHKAELLLQLLRPSFKRPLERHSAEIRHVLLEIRGATILPKLIDLAQDAPLGSGGARATARRAEGALTAQAAEVMAVQTAIAPQRRTPAAQLAVRMETTRRRTSTPKYCPQRLTVAQRSAASPLIQRLTMPFGTF